MISMNKKRIAFSCFIIVSCVIGFVSGTLACDSDCVANAKYVTYTLKNVSLSDGSRLCGSFTVNWNALPHERVTALSIMHTAGTEDSTGPYITYDPYTDDEYPDPVNYGVSGQTFESTFSLPTNTYTLAQYADAGTPDNVWTLSINNTLNPDCGIEKWQILYLDFNPNTGELFLDQWITTPGSVTPIFVDGSRFNDYVTRTAKTTWATITGGSLKIVCDPDNPPEERLE